LRDRFGRDCRVLWLSDMFDKVFAQSWQPPVSDWIGDDGGAEARPAGGESGVRRPDGRRGVTPSRRGTGGTGVIWGEPQTRE